MSAPPRSTAWAADTHCAARRLRLAGRVQGVGFRPFVFRLAHALGLAGSVQNLRGEVEILIAGTPASLERFTREVVTRAPPLAHPELVASGPAEMPQLPGFHILESAADRDAAISVPPDCFTCEECLAELADPRDRRYRYPFNNCTQCGPRYTLIDALPYDRANTTMAGFALCADCAREYLNPLDRRFHAEPVACPNCGPTLWFEEGPQAQPHPERGSPQEAQQALARAVAVLRAAGVLAVKGIGGYHLLCDARSAPAVERLRARKRRPHKPVAVLIPQQGVDGLDGVRREVVLSPAAAAELRSPARPIVLAPRRPDCTLAAAIAPGIHEIGVFLPYSPLHQLLADDFGGPLVATSGNVSGEPVLTEVAAAQAILGPIADASLHHDRPIARPADDSVVRVMLGRARAIRLGRGLAPRECALPGRLSAPVLATGGHLKAAVALAWDQRVVISPHIGDLGTARGEHVLAQVIDDLQRLYGVRAVEVVCDAHPDYATSRWAQLSGLPVTTVLHHHAHASALAGEHREQSPMLVFAWDGVGLGGDGTLWGGETFLGRPGSWRRVASLRPFRLPGGERAARAPWRSAAGLCWELGLLTARAPAERVVYEAWRRGVNSPVTSSVGRLFDAAAALVLGLREATFEGQGPMLWEAAAASARGGAESADELAPALPLYRDESHLLRIDWAPLVTGLLDPEASAGVRARRFHESLAATIAAIAEAQRAAGGVGCVGLTGGVFQNALLAELTYARLTERGFEVRLAEQLPCNDGGLSYGQLIELAGRRGA